MTCHSFRPLRPARSTARYERDVLPTVLRLDEAVTLALGKAMRRRYLIKPIVEAARATYVYWSPFTAMLARVTRFCLQPT